MMRRRSIANVAGVAVALALLTPAFSSTARAQDGAGESGGRGQFAGMQRVGGVITAIAGPQVTIKTADGAIYQVVTTDNTRVMRGRGNMIKLSDLKAGDGVMAMGNLDAPNKALHAAILMAIDPEQMKKLEDARKQEMANLGKTNIIGRVKAIDLDNATMTVERADGVSQTIGFDDGTSFRRGRPNMAAMGFAGLEAGGGTPQAQSPSVPAGESITLADIKVGDRVAGPGEVKGGRFVAKQLTVMTPGARRGPGADKRESGAAGTPDTAGQTPK